MKPFLPCLSVLKRPWIIGVALASLCLSPTAHAHKPPGVYNVLDYGAKGDGQTDDAPAIQKAIDACKQAGGGRVLLPAGKTYLSRALTLEGNMDFHIEPAATLRMLYENFDQPPKPFLSATNADYLSITGGGVIDGQGKRWKTGEEDDMIFMAHHRPGTMLIEASDHVTLKDITIRDAASWTVHLVGCEDVLITDIRILNDLRVPNSDGIDPNHCRNVRIANCHIEAGDDCIVLKNTKDYVQYGPTENITITGCTLSSSSTAIKIGTESHNDFRNIVVTACTIYNSNRGLAIQLRDHGDVENVIFSDITIETNLRTSRHWWGRAEPIYLTAIPRQENTQLGTIRNIQFNNIACKGENGVFIRGTNGGHIEGIRFDNLQVLVGRWSESVFTGEYDTRPGSGTAAYKSRISGIYCQDAKRLVFRNCDIAFGEKTQDHYDDAFKAVDVDGLIKDNTIVSDTH